MSDQRWAHWADMWWAKEQWKKRAEAAESRLAQIEDAKATIARANEIEMENLRLRNRADRAMVALRSL